MMFVEMSIFSDFIDVGIGILNVAVDEVTQDIALADAALTDQYENLLFTYPGFYLVCVVFACENFHIK